MKTTVTKWATKAAGAGAIALLLATPSFAQSRGNWNGNNDSNRGRQTSGARNNDNRSQNGQNGQNGQYGQYGQNGQNGTYNRSNNRTDNNGSRENQRITGSGQVRSFNRERDGYRVQLDRDNQSYWVPQSTFGNRARDLRAGVSISLGGVFRGGSVYVDAVTWPDQYGRGVAGNGYDNGYVRGVVDRVDYRSGTIWLRDDASGREITAAMNGGDRYGRSNLGNLRRGDYVELTGQWIRGGVFDVARVANISTQR